MGYEPQCMKAAGARGLYLAFPRSSSWSSTAALPLIFLNCSASQLLIMSKLSDSLLWFVYILSNQNK
jgi:hypothetical protein